MLYFKLVIHMIYHKGLGQGPGSLPNHSHGHRQKWHRNVALESQAHRSTAGSGGPCDCLNTVSRVWVLQFL